jgi:surfactin synthase thioesterase subunit
MAKLWVLLLAPVLACAQTNNSIAPPKVIRFSFPANGIAVVEAVRSGVTGLTTLEAVVALPQGFDPRRSWPVLLVTAPSGASAITALSAYTNVALTANWLAVAVSGPKVPVEKDNNLFAWGMISSLLDQLRRSWPQSKYWPFACAGFSGGGKRAAMTAAQMARQGDVVIGVFMGGCNDDRATDGYRFSRPGPAFLNVPFFLSNGTRDPIAGPSQAAEIKQSLESTGFIKIRLETYDGPHRLDTNHLRMALQWFSRPVRGANEASPAR